MKIYIVCSTDEGIFCGIFTDKAKAEERAYLMGECEILEYDTDTDELIEK